MASKKTTAVLLPNMGIYSDRPRIAMSPRMLSDGRNFRVKEGRLTNLNMGWTRFGSFQLNGPVVLVQDFFLRGGAEQLVFATLTDIYKYVSASSVLYLTPREETGTISISGTAVTGVGTKFHTNNVKAGHQLYVGAIGQNSTTAAWVTIASVTDDTHLTLSVTHATVTTQAFTIRKTYTGNLQNIWQAASFLNASPSGTDMLFITNGLDAICSWNGTDTQVVTYESFGFTAKAVTVYDNMLMFGNLTQGGILKPTDIVNSNPGTPLNFTTGLASQFRVHGWVDAIESLYPVGTNLAIYSHTNFGVVTLATFVGAPLVFQFLQVNSNVGPVGPKVVANYGNYHEFIGNDGQYYFDGATLKLINSQIWRNYLSTQDPARIGYSYTHFDRVNGDLIWVIPLTTDPNAQTTGGPSTAVGEHYLEAPGTSVLSSTPTPFSIRDFPFTASGFFHQQSNQTWDVLTNPWSSYNFRWNNQFFFAAFPLNVVGDDTGKLYTFNTSQDANGAALNSYVVFARRPLFDGRTRGLLSRIYPFAEQFVTPVQVTAMMADSADGNPLITDTQSFDQSQPEGGHFTVHYRRGRYFEVKMGSTGPGQPWEIAGYDFDTRQGGKR